MISACLLADAAAQAATRSPERVFRLRVLGASAILLFALFMLILIVGYLMRRWRRTMRERLPPSDYDPDAWARKPLIPQDNVPGDELV
jgi:hypothetical protein